MPLFFCLVFIRIAHFPYSVLMSPPLEIALLKFGQGFKLSSVTDSRILRGFLFADCQKQRSGNWGRVDKLKDEQRRDIAASLCLILGNNCDIVEWKGKAGALWSSTTLEQKQSCKRTKSVPCASNWTIAFVKPDNCEECTSWSLRHKQSAECRRQWETQLCVFPHPEHSNVPNSIIQGGKQGAP